jgi:hypothetical protein
MGLLLVLPVNQTGNAVIPVKSIKGADPYIAAGVLINAVINPLRKAVVNGKVIEKQAVLPAKAGLACQYQTEGY